jgi:membrane protease YdiL (CAAX protease family)
MVSLTRKADNDGSDMKSWLSPLLLIAVLVLVALLTATALPSLSGEHLGGNTLLLHMMASGALVFALPLFALAWLRQSLDHERSTPPLRWGFWLVLVTGMITIATVFACMLPIPSTDQMHELVRWHGYAGFAMVPAALLLAWGAVQARRITSTRSSSPG